MIVRVLRKNRINDNNEHKRTRNNGMRSSAKSIESGYKGYTHEVNGHENGTNGNVSEDLLCLVRINIIETCSDVVNDGCE